MNLEKLEEERFQLPRGPTIRLYLLAPPEPLVAPDLAWTSPAPLTAHLEGDEVCQPPFPHLLLPDYGRSEEAPRSFQVRTQATRAAEL